MAGTRNPKPAKKKPTGNYPVGYCQPPSGSKFTPGKSGNPSGLPKGLPTPQQIFIEQAARVVKVKMDDKVVTMSMMEMVVKKLYNMASAGDIGAIRLVLAYLTPAHAELANAAPDIEPPLTEAEIAIFETFKPAVDYDSA